MTRPCRIGSTPTHAHPIKQSLFDQLHVKLKEQIKLAQSRYQVLANSKRSSAPEFAIGSHVFVKAQFFHTTQPSKKLTKKYLGPFKVIA